MPQYQMVEISRMDGENAPNYVVYALPEGKSFKSEDNYDRFEACWLKLNGYGFSGDGVEISEHGKTVEIEQETEGGSLRITLE